MLIPDQISPYKTLIFSSVKGTTAKTSAQFVALGDKLAYVAGSGVLVATIGEDSQICSQRLFVANAISEPCIYGLELFQSTACEDELRKDLFGYPVNFTHFYRGSPIETELLSTSLLEAKELSSFMNNGAKLKDKVRAPTCLAISPNGRVLAVGETGYQPRLLLFSLAPDSSGKPFAVVHEHSFGINHVAFSPNLKYFCSLGTMSDGFLHVWKYSPTAVARRAGNKCSSVVNDLLWHNTGSGFGEIVTVGLRFLKIWLLDQAEISLPSKVAILKGRNFILGKFLESNFQAVIPVSPSQLIIKEHTGLYLLNLENDNSIRQTALDHLEISGLVADTLERKLWVLDRDLKLHMLNLDDLEVLPETEAQPKSALSPSRLAPGMQKLRINSDIAIIKALNMGDGHIAYLTREGNIFSHHKETKVPKKLVSPPVSSVAGGKRSSTGEILLFSKTGTVSVLDDARSIVELAVHELPQAEGILNELTAVEKTKTLLFLGDKFGLLTVLDLSEEAPKVKLVLKAHASSINDIIYFEAEKVPLLCSISRDRMVQVYCKRDVQWEILVTLPIHTANLLSVKYNESHLFVCSADRSISIHEIVRCENPEAQNLQIEIVHKKTISSKMTPLSMEVSDSNLVISSSDRSLSVYDRQTLELKRNIKLYGEKSTDPLCVDRFLLLPNNQIAVFCSDRSLRVFNLSSGKHIHCVWGHLELVIGLLEDNGKLLSLGSDGCFFEWAFRIKSGSENQITIQTNENTIPNPEPVASPLFAKVTRKFLPNMSKAISSPRKATSLSCEDAGLTEPESPTPRLTNATLKRLEARKKAEMLSVSSSKASSSENSPTIKSPFHSKQLSSPKIRTSPLQTPFNKGQTPTRETQLSRSLHIAARNHRSASPQKVSAPSLPPPTSSDRDARERSTAYLTMIKSFITKNVFDKEDKDVIRNELEEVLALLGGQNRFESLLEKYSDDLVSLVQKKILEE